MKWPQQLSFRRPSLSYSIDKLNNRDEIILKSSMRVLDHRTRHHWKCVERGADLRLTTNALDVGSGPEMLLYVGCDVVLEGATLPLPLRASEVEEAFNRAGDAILRARAAAQSMPTRMLLDDDEFRLRRWPVAALLNTREHLTLATMMSAGPSSVTLLQQRSALPMQICRDFVRDLHRVGLLNPLPNDSVQPPSGTSSTAMNAPTGLLARIRARLGLATTPSR